MGLWVMKCWSSPKHASQTHMPMLLNRDFFCVRPISRIAQNWGRPGTAPHPMPGIAEYVHTPHGFPGLGARNVYTLRAANTPFFGSRAFTQASMSRTRYQSNQPPPPKVRSTTTSTGEVWLAPCSNTRARTTCLAKSTIREYTDHDNKLRTKPWLA